MATINLGQLGFPYMGIYSPLSTYKKGQIVLVDTISKTLVIAEKDIPLNTTPDKTKLLTITGTNSDGFWHIYYAPSQYNYRGIGASELSLPVLSSGNKAMVVGETSIETSDTKSKNLSAEVTGYNHYNKFTTTVTNMMKKTQFVTYSQLNGAKVVDYDRPIDKRIAQLASGSTYRSTLALSKDNRIVMFGEVASYARGTGTVQSEERSVNFTKIPSLSKIKKVYGFLQGGAALLENNELWVWGRNDYGHLGVGHGSAIPMPVLSATNVKEFYGHESAESGYMQSCYVATNGDVYAAGYNGNGHFGDGTTTNSTTWKKALITLVDRLYFDHGGSTTTWYAIKTNGELWGWGYNNNGQLGTNNLTQQNTPIKINIPFLVSHVATGNQSNVVHTLVVSQDGTQVYGAGYNGYGQLANGNTTQQQVFIPCTLLNTARGTGTITQLETSKDSYGTCIALTSLGKVITWAYNGYGQLGNGNTTTLSTSVYTVLDYNSSTHPVKKVLLGGYGSYGWGIIWEKDRTTGIDKIKVSGYNGNLQLGIGHNSNVSTYTEIPFGYSDEQQNGIRDIRVYGHDSESRYQVLTETGQWWQTGNTWNWHHANRAGTIQKIIV